MTAHYILLAAFLSAVITESSRLPTLCRESCSEFGPWTLSLSEANKPCRCLKFGGYRILSQSCSHFQECLESCDDLGFDHAFCSSQLCICANAFAIFVATTRVKRKGCTPYFGGGDCLNWCRRRGFSRGWCSPEEICKCQSYRTITRNVPVDEKSTHAEPCIVPSNMCARVCVTMGFEGGFCIHNTCTCSQDMKNSFKITYIDKNVCDLDPYQCILKCAFIFHQKATCIGSKCVCLERSSHPLSFATVNDESFRGYCHVPHNYCFRMCLDTGYADGYCIKSVCECLLGRKSRRINLLDETSCVRAKDICREVCVAEQFLNDVCYDTDCLCYTGSSYLVKKLQRSQCFIPETFCRYLCHVKSGIPSRFVCNQQACTCTDVNKENLTITMSEQCDVHQADCHTQCQLDGFDRSFCTGDICGCLDSTNIYFSTKTVTATEEYTKCEVPIRYCRHFCNKQGYALGTCEGSRCLCVAENAIFELGHRKSCLLPENRCELSCSESSFPNSFCVQKHCLCTTTPEGQFSIKS